MRSWGVHIGVSIEFNAGETWFADKFDVRGLVAPEVIEQSGATTASDIWSVRSPACLAFRHPTHSFLLLGVSDAQ